MSGDLVKNKIIVKKSKDVGRLYNKSDFGKTISDNQLELNLLEGIFLLGDKKINIYSKKKEVRFRDLIKLAAEKIPAFEIKYLAFRDLRYRGHAVRIAPNVDTIVLASGDGDFVQLVGYLKGQGKRVEIIAFERSASLKLREAADEFIDIEKNPGKYLLKIKK